MTALYEGKTGNEMRINLQIIRILTHLYYLEKFIVKHKKIHIKLATSAKYRYENPRDNVYIII